MLSSIAQVNEEFFSLFHKVSVTVGGKSLSIPSRYARKSSKDYSEEQANQEYPCIAIQDFAPNPKQDWFIDMDTYCDGFLEDSLKAFLFQRPLWMEFQYDVSIAAKGYKEYIALQDYFIKKFTYEKRFLFNKKFAGTDDEVGDVVPYELRTTDIPRADGVFETNYEFVLSAWLYVADPIEVDIITRIVLNIKNGQ